MRVKIQQFLFGGTLFSWAIVGQSIGRSLLNLGHDVEFVSTDDVNEKYVPKDLIPHVRVVPSGSYDCQISYTAMHNFPPYLGHGRKNRFGIWNYDGTHPPAHKIKYHNFCDKFCPSSDFSKQIFANSGIPEEKMVVVPHGINLEEFQTDDKYKLKTKKKYKILLNIATPHLRKNIKKTLYAYGKAFTKSDDVCLVIKVSLNKGKKDDRKGFNIDFYGLLNDFYKKFKNHGEVEVVRGFIPSLASIYNACDIVFMMSNMEMWWLPGTEAFACNKLVVASNYGGQLHYLNNENSLLIDGKTIRMPKHYQYWDPSPYAEMFDPSIEDGARKLRQAVENYDELLVKFSPKMKEKVNELTWDNVGKQIVEMCDEG
jgi:glycosyltransferase involved in cell wall biosynthesis